MRKLVSKDILPNQIRIDLESNIEILDESEMKGDNLILKILNSFDSDSDSGNYKYKSEDL